MKKFILSAAFITLICFTPSNTYKSDNFDFKINKASVQFGQNRPFSFFYPYKYKFYTPRSEYYKNVGACQWVYANGKYVYTCSSL